MGASPSWLGREMPQPVVGLKIPAEEALERQHVLAGAGLSHLPLSKGLNLPVTSAGVFSGHFFSTSVCWQDSSQDDRDRACCLELQGVKHHSIR